MSLTGAITYVLVLPQPPENEDYSPFQWFSRDILVRSATIRALLRLPSSVLELAHERDLTLIARLRGAAPYQIVPLYVGSLEGMITNPLSPFLCLVSDEATVDHLLPLVLRAPRPVLHVTTAQRSNVQRLDTLTRAHLLDYCTAVKAFLEARGVPLPMLRLPAVPSAWTRVALPIGATDHPVALPNELALQSAGFDFDLAGGENPIPDVDSFDPARVMELDAPYAQLIIRSVRALEAARAGHLARACPDRSRLGVDAILSAPGVLPQILARRADQQRNFPAILRSLIRQRRYRHLLLTPKQLTELASPAGAAAIATRRLELDGYTTALAVRAAGYFAPVLRLPPGVNRVRGQLAHLAACTAAHGSNKSRRMSRLAHQIGQTLQDETPPEILAHLHEAVGAIKLVADAPLELLPVDGAPLGLRRVVSRVPVTPGNSFAALMLTGEVLRRTPAELRRILVIRSFADADPRRRDLERAVNAYMAASKDGLELTWRDVHSTEELIQALNDFTGSVMVFDGHGFRGSLDEPAAIVVGDQHVDVATLRHRVRIPPIVILRACDAARVDLSHATTVGAFLMLGAVSVLGSLAPVDSQHSARLVGRLLFRLAEYLPVFEQRSGLIQWSEVVNGLLRMNYVTDMLAIFKCHNVVRLSDSETARVQMKANTLINSFQGRWLEETVDLVASTGGRPAAEVEAARRELAYFTETLSYLHFGWPEDIFVAGSDFETRGQRVREAGPASVRQRHTNRRKPKKRAARKGRRGRRAGRAR